ncbi:hypothetical protein ABI924_02760, partial [Chromobacterium phragmitis]
MREQNQQQTPYDGEDESNLNGKLKKRLWIAGGLVAVALAAIPLMDALTKQKVEMNSDAQSPSSGKIIKPASSPETGAIIQPKPASAPTEQSSAPITETANSAPAAPAESAPATPDLSKTPAIANQQAPRHAPSQTTPIRSVDALSGRAQADVALKRGLSSGVGWNWVEPSNQLAQPASNREDIRA